jgi:putative Mg2+ transporter-C (MgtC) family protein
VKCLDFLDWLLPDEAMTVTVRLLLAALLSGLVGIEREIKRHPAGFRTHLLVGMGACLMMLLSVFGFESYLHSHTDLVRFDPSRMPSYVISGIGFLGAGTILVHGVTVKGLTTAASIWVVAGIGLVVGIGMYYEAVLTTVVVILSLFFLNNVEKIFIKTSETERLNIVVRNKKVSLSKIVEVLEEQGTSVKQVSVENYPDADNTLMKYTLLVQFPEKDALPYIYDLLYENEDVYKVYTAD